MNINFNLNLQQSQKLILTKELRQSLEILQMPTFKLEDMIVEESQENPLLEVEKKDEIDWEKYLNNLSKTTTKESISYNKDDDNNKSDYENMIKEELDLYTHLMEQLGYVKNINSKEKDILEFMIYSLNDNGYLEIEDEIIKEKFNLDTREFNKLLKIMQSMDPVGIGARNLEETLIIQLKDKNIKDQILYSIIKKDLNMIARKAYREIAKKYNVKSDKVIDYCKIIKTLEPRPGRKYNNNKAKYITPDVFVEKTNGKFMVRINETSVPTIKINKFYESILLNTKDNDAKEYIKEKLTKVSNLIKNIESRKNTILKVSKEIVKEQREFFEFGKRYLKPMTMKEIANTLEFHESTISRTVNGKYMLTPYGLYELKYFFRSSPKNEDMSSIGIKDVIKELVENENKKKPLSDQKIVDILKEKQINISRRTVAKYRDEMGILSSSKRKEM